jgi:hypothetical protein
VRAKLISLPPFSFQSVSVMSDELQEPTTPQSLFMAVGTLAMCTTLLLLIASFW